MSPAYFIRRPRFAIVIAILTVLAILAVFAVLAAFAYGTLSQTLGEPAAKGVRSGPSTGCRRAAVQCLGYASHGWMAKVDRRCRSENRL